jgi:hypothetical protein
MSIQCRQAQVLFPFDRFELELEDDAVRSRSAGLSKMLRAGPSVIFWSASAVSRLASPLQRARMPADSWTTLPSTTVSTERIFLMSTSGTEK